MSSMQKKEESTLNKRKIFSGFILLLLLIVFPAMSWFYLNRGLEWRRSVQAELRNYGRVRAANHIFGNEKINLIQGKVCVLHNFGIQPELTEANKSIMDIGEKLQNQFGHNDAFRLAMIASQGSPEFRAYAQKKSGSDGPIWVWTVHLEDWDAILSQGYNSYCRAENTTPASHYFALSDTTGMIRCYYDASKKEETDQMVTHISLLLPAK